MLSIDNNSTSAFFPWYTDEEYKQVSEQLRYLKQIDSQTNRWRDLTWMDFRPEVLDKYRNSRLCKVADDCIAFLRQLRHHDKDDFEFVSYVSFLIKENVLMMYAKEFNNIPPIERNHWYEYQIKQPIVDK
jgi:hypothetical protein